VLLIYSYTLIKLQRRFLKEEKELSKISKNELSLESITAFEEESVILLMEEMSTTKSLQAFTDFLVANQESLSSKRKKASIITNIDLSKAMEEFFHEIFNRVADIQGKYLPKEELVEVLKADNKDELAIAAAIDKGMKIITFTKGDLSKITVPFSFFLNVSEKLKIESIELCDYGQTVKFGKVEIAFDSILYEFSGEYRKNLIKKRRAENKTFGACLRRYRMLKEMKQSSFKSVTEKEISRIENEKVTPHKNTIKDLLEELKITEDELLTY